MVILALLGLVVNKNGLAQTWEVGLHLGASNYLGDLAPRLVLGETREMLGIQVKKNYSGYFSLAGNLVYGQISGNDQNFEQNAIRNLSFRSRVIELSLQYEFNFQKYLIGLRSKNFSPYTFIGAGAFFHNPQAQYQGEWYNLRPLGTEGQFSGGADKYYNFAACIPMGGGFKWQIARRLNLTAYTGFRFTYTDYLDDVSTNYHDPDAIASNGGSVAAALADRSIDFQNAPGKERGNASNNDWYMFTGFTISYMLKDPDCPAPY